MWPPIQTAKTGVVLAGGADSRYGRLMRARSLGVVCLFVSFLFAPENAFPCTTFCLDAGEGAVIGKSYDWDFGDARLYVNKAGVGKKAVVLEGTPHTWKSRYASLTFNQFGREFPNGGINEKGLVIEVMMLGGTRHPDPDERPAVNELQWIQYNLDRYATVQEVYDHAEEIRVSPTSERGQVHYMVCDRGGACGTFEYIDKRLKRTAGKELTVSVLANDSYDDARKHLKKFEGFGGKAPIPRDASSPSRFVIAAQGTKSPGKNPVESAFATLDRVRNGSYTKWNIVYDTGAMQVHFRSLNHDTIKRVDLGKLFSDKERTCRTPVKMLDLNIDRAGDVTSAFYDYSTAENVELVRSTLGRVGVPKALIALAGRYPDALPCAP